MQITPDQLFDEAANMALELRMKDRMLGALKAENERLQTQVKELGGEVPAAAVTPEPPHGHSH